MIFFYECMKRYKKISELSRCMSSKYLSNNFKSNCFHERDVEYIAADYCFESDIKFGVKNARALGITRYFNFHVVVWITIIF